MQNLRKSYSSKKIKNIENDRFGITNDNFMFINVNKIDITTCIDILIYHKKIILFGNNIQDILDTYTFNGITHLIIITQREIKSLAKLPISLKYLQLGNYYNLIKITINTNPFTNLPYNLTYLELNLQNFCGSFSYLPNSIKTLSIHIDEFISKSSDCIMNLPSSIKTLNLSTGYYDCRYNFSEKEYRSIKFLDNFLSETILNFINKLQVCLPISIKKINLYFGMKQHLNFIDKNKITAEFPKLKIYSRNT